MKFWQLLSLSKGQKGLIPEKASQREEWSRFGKWYEQADALITAQDRGVLDHPLPDDFVRCVLSDLPIVYYLSGDSWLRRVPRAPGDKPLSILDAYNSYGDLVEEVWERGPIQVGRREKEG